MERIAAAKEESRVVVSFIPTGSEPNQNDL
jgi:hypothetical protein